MLLAMSKREVFIADPSFTLKWEKLEGQLFVHIEVVEASASIISRIKEAWMSFMAQAYFEGYEDIFTYTRDPRIVNIVGGAIELKDDRLNDAPGWRMYKWDLR